MRLFQKRSERIITGRVVNMSEKLAHHQMCVFQSSLQRSPSGSAVRTIAAHVRPRFFFIDSKFPFWYKYTLLRGFLGFFCVCVCVRGGGGYKFSMFLKSHHLITKFVWGMYFLKPTRKRSEN